MSLSSCTIDCDSLDATLRLGQKLGTALNGGEVIALIGQLGAGKTQFVKGLAAGNGITDAAQVTSPTFTLANEYPGRLYLYHLDAYRLQTGRDLDALGFDEMYEPGCAAVVEWADRVIDALPDDRLAVQFHLTGPESRRLTFTASGEVSRRLLPDITTGE